MEKPLFTKKQIMYRSFKNFDIDLFISDTRSSSLISDTPNKLDDLVALYDSELSGIFNRHVPIEKRTVTIRSAAPWYSEELKSEKREKRRLERRWRASRSMRDHEAYMRQCKVLKNLLSSSTSNYYSNLVAANQSNMRSLFADFSKLLHRRHEAKYPKHDSSSSLANDFVLFFGDKIRRIRRDLDQVPPLDTAVDSNNFKNYRPISNLRFISKTIEKCVAKQLIQYLDINDLGETYQYAYKRNHSTETALIRVHNDIAMAIDQHNSVILVLLNLSAAFDTVDHGILFSRLSNRFGITGTVLEWFRSYLSDRTQFVQVNGACSASHVLEFGVPQGSVLGPLLYSMHTSPLGEIARRHQMFYHFYADDTQLYITFRTSSVSDMNLSNAKLVNCFRDMDAWMLSNKLK